MGRYLAMSKILVVDDETNVARSIRRLLKSCGFEVLLADDGDSALDTLRDHPDIAVIVSDQRMPKMSGSELLAKVAADFPDVIRIILTGYAEFDSVRDAVNRGNIFRFLLKPWDDEELVACVTQGAQYFQVAQENHRLQQALQLANQNLEHKVAQRTRALNMNIRSLERYEKIVEKIPLGILCVSDDDMVALSNEALMNLLDVQSAIEGIPYQKVLPVELHPLIDDFHDGRVVSLSIQDQRVIVRTMILEVDHISFGKLLTLERHENH